MKRSSGVVLLLLSIFSSNFVTAAEAVQVQGLDRTALKQAVVPQFTFPSNRRLKMFQEQYMLPNFSPGKAFSCLQNPSTPFEGKDPNLLSPRARQFYDDAVGIFSRANFFVRNVEITLPADTSDEKVWQAAAEAREYIKMVWKERLPRYPCLDPSAVMDVWDWASWIFPSKIDQ